MRIFQNRPLALAACAFALTSYLCLGLPAVSKLILMLPFFVLSIVFLFRLIKQKHLSLRGTLTLLISMAICISALQSAVWFDAERRFYRSRKGEQVAVEGYTLSREYGTSYYTELYVILEERDGRAVHEKVLLKCEYGSSLQAGDRFRLTGEVATAENSYLISDGVKGALICRNAESCTVFGEREHTLRLALSRLQHRLSSRLSGVIGGEEGDLASALLLGERSGLNADTTLSFQRSGISHLLALSGLHVSILMGILEGLLRLLRVTKKGRIAVVLSAATFYLLLTGCALSTLRSVSMVFLLYLGACLGESYDPFTALSTALMGILLLTPNAAADAGMWMSFAATAGIVVFVPAVNDYFEQERFDNWPYRIKKAVRGLISLIAVGCYANAAILLIVAPLFGRISLFSIPITLLLSPILTPTLVLCLLVLMLPQVDFLGRGCALLLRLIMSVADRVSEIPNALVLTSGEITSFSIMLLGWVILICAVIRLRRRWLLLPLALSFTTLFLGYVEPLMGAKELTVTCLSQAQAGALVFTKGNCAMAVDLSDGDRDVIDEIIDVLTEQGCSELEELVLLRYDSAHASLLNAASGKLKLRVVRLPPPKSVEEEQIAARLAQEAELHGMRLIFGMEGITFSEMELLGWDRVSYHGNSTPLWLSFRVNGKMITYLDEEMFSSKQGDLVLNYAQSSELLLLGNRSGALDVIPLESLPLSMRILALSHLEDAPERVEPLVDSTIIPIS